MSSTLTSGSYFVALSTLAVTLMACGLDSEDPAGSPDDEIPTRVCAQHVLSEAELKAGLEAEPLRCYDSDEELKAAEIKRIQAGNARAAAGLGSWTLYYSGEAYEHSYLGGAKYIYLSWGDCPQISYVGDSWNDRMSSMAYKPWNYQGVYADSGCNAVAIYEDANYNGPGAAFCFGKTQGAGCIYFGGRALFSDINLTTVLVYPPGGPYNLNDRVSSLRWAVYAY